MPLVLVIDDEARVRQQVRRILAAASHEVIEAADGEIGVALLREQRPSVVITDIVMPKKDGIETIREIRCVSPNTRIIAISGGHGGPSDMLYLDVAKKLGADAILAKPFRKADLLQTIARVLARKDV